MLKSVKWTGAILGVVGCYLLAVNLPWSKYAFVIYFFSSLLMLSAALKEKDRQYTILNLAFLMGNILAIFKWVLK